MKTAETTAPIGTNATSPEDLKAQVDREFFDFLDRLVNGRTPDKKENTIITPREGQSRMAALAEQSVQRLMAGIEEEKTSKLIITATVTLPGGTPFVMAVAAGEGAADLRRRCAF